MATMRRVVVATRNQGKLAEIREILGEGEFEFVSMSAFCGIPEIKETGKTFAENATIKAVLVAKLTGELAIADDSGLCVDALDGGPGIYSARFAGPGATDEDNIAKLLFLMRDVPPDARGARFVCAAAVASPSGETRVVHGICEGLILQEKRGTSGFGYDPIFFVPDYGKTFAQLGPEVKNRISHRARAFGLVLPILREFSQRSSC